ncbi:MAG: DUF898 domain-containing protein [Pseudomonadales bacterium]|nr:DUF898 domain-containing protein [Pseudomonadales bacterium]
MMGSTPETVDLSPESEQGTKHIFNFTGDTGEYFGIWFVNGLLTMLTLGLYSPWAKVRKMQYFYGNAELANGSFQFLASAATIFKSRMIAGALLILFITAEEFVGVFTTATVIYLGMLAVYLFVAPIIIMFTMSFRLRYSSWRGVQFRFNKDYKWAYRVYIGPSLVQALLIASIVVPIYIAMPDEEDFLSQESGISEQPVTENEFDGLISETPDTETDIPSENTNPEYGTDYTKDYDEEVMKEEVMKEEIAFKDLFNFEPIHFIPAMLMALIFLATLPYFDFINTRFLAANTKLGTSPVTFHANAEDYYRIYGAWLGISVVLVMSWFSVFALAKPFEGESAALFGTSTITILIFASVLYVPFSRAYLRSRRYNVLFKNVEFGQGHRMQAHTTLLSYLWLMVSNGIAMALSFGFLSAWVQIRTMRYFLAKTYLNSTEDLDQFVAAQQEEVHALGEEISDLFDADIGF